MDIEYLKQLKELFEKSNKETEEAYKKYNSFDEKKNSELYSSNNFRHMFCFSVVFALAILLYLGLSCLSILPFLVFIPNISFGVFLVIRFVNHAISKRKISRIKKEDYETKNKLYKKYLDGKSKLKDFAKQITNYLNEFDEKTITSEFDLVDKCLTEIKKSNIIDEADNDLKFLLAWISYINYRDMYAFIHKKDYLIDFETDNPAGSCDMSEEDVPYGASSNYRKLN